MAKPTKAERKAFTLDRRVARQDGFRPTNLLRAAAWAQQGVPESLRDSFVDSVAGRRGVTANVHASRS